MVYDIVAEHQNYVDVTYDKIPYETTLTGVHYLDNTDEESHDNEVVFDADNQIALELEILNSGLTDLGNHTYKINITEIFDENGNQLPIDKVELYEYAVRGKEGYVYLDETINFQWNAETQELSYSNLNARTRFKILIFVTNTAEFNPKACYKY